MNFNLDGRRFCYFKETDEGRVRGDGAYFYKQTGQSFEADYHGGGFTDGHLIGVMTGPDSADLVYHCRAPDGALEVGEAAVTFSTTAQGAMEMSMRWRWLNGPKESGLSQYEEIMGE